MSGDCSWMDTAIPHVSPSKPYFARVYPISETVLRTIDGMSMYVEVEISPATHTSPVVMSVSHATRPNGSSVKIASRMASDTWSAILSGWPSVTDSEVYSHRRVMFAPSKRRAGDPARGEVGGYY